MFLEASAVLSLQHLHHSMSTLIRPTGWQKSINCEKNSELTTQSQSSSCRIAFNSSAERLSTCFVYSMNTLRWLELSLMNNFWRPRAKNRARKGARKKQLWKARTERENREKKTEIISRPSQSHPERANSRSFPCRFSLCVDWFLFIIHLTLILMGQKVFLSLCVVWACFHVAFNWNAKCMDELT